MFTCPFATYAILVPSGEYAGSLSVVPGVVVRFVPALAVVVGIVQMSPPCTYATSEPLNERVGCVAAGPVGRSAGSEPSASAMLIPDGVTYAIALSSDDHVGSTAFGISVRWFVPPELTWQMLVPQVYAIGPLSPEKAPPAADESGMRAAAHAATAMRLLLTRCCTRLLYRGPARAARVTGAPGGTSRGLQ